MINLRYDPATTDASPASGQIALIRGRDCVVFRLFGIDPESAIRLTVKPSGENPHVEIAASASRAPGNNGWLNPLSPINSINDELATLLTGWQLIRVRTMTEGGSAHVSFVAHSVKVTHNWLPNASLQSKTIKIENDSTTDVSLLFDPAGGGESHWILSEELRIHQLEQLSHLGDRLMEPADYTWEVNSMNRSMVLASLSEYTSENLKVKLQRIGEGLVEVDVTGTPHHGGSIVRATITVT